MSLSDRLARRTALALIGAAAGTAIVGVLTTAVIGSASLALVASIATILIGAWPLAHHVVRPPLAGWDTLERAAAAVEAGDYGVRASGGPHFRTPERSAPTAVTSAGLARVGRAFDRLIEAREQVIATARADSERINESVIAVLQAVEQLSQRDLTAKAPVTEDIVGAISDSINKLAYETAVVLDDVNVMAREVERASRDVKSQADQVSANAANERSGLQGMVDVLSRASESMQRVALLAYNCNRIAGQASRATENALESVASTVSGMSSIRATITDVERRIKRLGERSHEIGQIVNLINTLSERTHVLALNASMQAAMAGEAGRGFAVVAEEVQRLAESSREATDRIGKLIYNIQMETTDAIGAMAKTIDRIVHEASVTETSGARMTETRETTAKLVEMVGRISESAAEQMTIATQLRARIDEIGAGNASDSEQLAAQHAATESLLGIAARLVAAVRVFKLPASASR